jgi:PAS domain S-box-containing protein
VKRIQIPFFKRIGIKIVLILLVVSFTAVLVTGATLISLSTETLKVSILQRNLQIARRASSEITRYLEDSVKELKNVAQILVQFHDNRFFQSMILENLVYNNDRYGSICLVDEDGTVLADSALDNVLIPRIDEKVIRDTPEKNNYFSPVRLDANFFPYTLICFRLMVVEKQSEILVTELNLRDIWSMVDDISFGERIQTLLISSNSIIIAHPDKSQVLSGADASELEGVTLPLPQNGLAMVQRQKNGGESLAVFVPLRLTDWTMIIRQPIDEAFLPVKLTIIRYSLIVLSVLIMAVVVSVFLAMSLYTPLKQLVAGTVAIGSGDLSHRIEVKRGDEIGQLADSFNEMVEKLQHETELLTESEQKYRLIAESVYDIVLSLDSRGRFTSLNRRTEELLGKRSETILKHSFSRFLTPDSAERFKRTFKAKLKDVKSCASELEVALHDGEGSKNLLEIKLIRDSSLVESPQSPQVYIVGRDITEQRRAEENLLEYQSQLRSLASRLSLTEAKERKRIAVDIHDRIGQSLAIVKMRLWELTNRTISKTRKESIQRIISVVEQIIEDTGSLTFDLASPLLYELGLLPALEQLAERTQQEHGLKIHFKDNFNNGKIETDIALLLYEAVRELLFNVVKHASAKDVWLTVAGDRETVYITVRDNGHGFITTRKQPRASKTEGFGLFSIRERLNYIGGSLELRSVPGRGTEVILIAPVTSALK